MKKNARDIQKTNSILTKEKKKAKAKTSHHQNDGGLNGSCDIGMPEYDEKYLSLIEFASGAFFHGDAEGNLITVNKKAIELTGYTRSELLQMNITDLFPPEVLEKKPLEYDLLKIGKTISNEREIILKNGRKLEILMTSKLMPDGTYQCFASDNTERKKAEESLNESVSQWQTTFDALNDAVCIIDADQKILRYNRAMRELFPVNGDDITGKYCWEIVHGTNEPRHDCPIRIMKKTLHRESMQFNIKSKWYEVIVDPLFVTDGNLLGAVHIVRDITEHKHAKENLLHINDQLNELNKTKNKLISIIAHDLRSPFNSILGFSELLSTNIQYLDRSKIEKYAEHIHSSSKQVLYLLDNLLDWARAQTGLIVFNPLKINLGIQVQEIIEVFEASARLKNILLENFVPESIIVFADENMLRSILRNIISNAIKFSYPGSKVTIFAHSDGKNIKVSISDTGTGIDDSLKSKLFSSNGINTTSGTLNESGSGLGLVLCKEFVDRHGGRIWVESQPGKGSEFCFTLPLFTDKSNGKSKEV